MYVLRKQLHTDSTAGHNVPDVFSSSGLIAEMQLTLTNSQILRKL